MKLTPEQIAGIKWCHEKWAGISDNTPELLAHIEEVEAERAALRTALEEVVYALKGHHKNKDYESIYSADAEDIAFQALRSKESEPK